MRKSPYVEPAEACADAATEEPGAQSARAARPEERGRVLHVVPPPDDGPASSSTDVDTVSLVRGEHLSPYRRELEGRYFLVNGLGVAGLTEGGFLTRGIADEIVSRWTVASRLLLAGRGAEERARALHRYVYQLLRHQTYPAAPPRRRTVTSRRSPAQALSPTPAPAQGPTSAYLPLALDEVCQALGVTPYQISILLNNRVLRAARDISGESITPARYDFAGVHFWHQTLYGRDLRGTPRPAPPPEPPSLREEDGSVDSVLLSKLYPGAVRHPKEARLPREGLHAAYHALIHALMDYYDVPELQLTAAGRVPFMVEARAVAIHIMHQCWGIGPIEIARWLARDHSTVMHHLRLYYYAPTPEFLHSLHNVKSRIAPYLPYNAPPPPTPGS